jgi:undecaprenyl-diphosphatase
MINTFNQQLFFFINRAAGHWPLLDHFFLFVTNVFVSVLVVGAIVWFFVILPRKTSSGMERLRRYGDAGLLLLSLGLVWCITEVIKGAVAFPRPQQLLTGVHILSTFGSYDSFPSAHTAFAFAIATFVYQYSRRAGLLAILLAVLVGVSRIFVGVHFPIDVLVGSLIGVIVPWGIVSLLRHYTF